MRVLIAIALALLAVDALPALKPRSTKVERETLKIRAPTRKQIAARARKPQLKNKTPGNELDFITPIFGPQLIFSMGTPSQDFLGGEIDTTSGDSWIVDIRADQPEPAPWQFDPRNSSTIKISNYPYTADVVDVNGLPAKISGNLADEIFTVFNQKFQMRFPLIEQITPYLQTAEVPDVFATGRFGFGFHATDYVDLFLPKLFSHVNATQRTLTSVIFECMPADNVEESTSEFSIGYMDTTFCNASTTVKVPLTDGGHWNFYINSFTFLNMTSTTKQQAILNTRELLTGVPTNLYNYVYKTLNATVNPDYAWPIVDCNQNFPLLTVKSNGDTFPITSEQYIFKDFAVDETPCHLMLYPMNGGGFLPSWSFGYIWMYQKCITFDYGRRQLAFTDYNNGLCDQN